MTGHRSEREREIFFKSIPSTLCFKVNQVNNWRRKKAKEKRRKNLKNEGKEMNHEKRKKNRGLEMYQEFVFESQNVTKNLKS